MAVFLYFLFLVVMVFAFCACYHYKLFKNRVLLPVISVFLSPIILDRIVVTVIPENIQSEIIYNGGAFIGIFTLFVLSKIFHIYYSLKEYIVFFSYMYTDICNFNYSIFFYIH